MMAVVMAVMALWATVAIAAINEVQDGSALQAQEKNGKDQEQGHGDDQRGCGRDCESAPAASIHHHFLKDA
jgi:hypothetical protein